MSQGQGVELGQPPAADARRDAVHVAIVPASYHDDDEYDTWQHVSLEDESD